LTNKYSLNNFLTLLGIRGVNIDKKLTIVLVVLFSLISVEVFAKGNIEFHLSRISKAYGSSRGSDNWAPYADVNHDGIVDIKDLALVSKNGYSRKWKKSGINSSPQTNSTNISVEPEKTYVGSVLKNFTIDINITEALDTWAWQFNLSWDPFVLNITNITEGTFLSQGVYDTSLAQDPPVAIVINYTQGWALVGNTLLEEPTIYPSGDGTLATINFTVLDTVPDLGNSILRLNETILILDDGETNYTHETEDGYFVLCFGDVNRNGKVDSSDLLDMSKAYGSDPSKPNWNSDCDLNNNNKVDASDLFNLSKNYGKSC